MEVYRCAACDLRVFVDDSQALNWDPVLHGRRGFFQGLLPAALTLLVLLLTVDRGLADLWTWWPAYLAMPLLCMAVSMLDLGPGLRYGLLLGVWVLHLAGARALETVYFTYRHAAAAELGLAALACLGLALGGLASGRLPVLDLRHRRDIAKIFIPAAILLVLAAWATPGERRGQIHFDRSLAVVNGNPEVLRPRRFFSSGETLSLVAYFRHPPELPIHLNIHYESVFHDYTLVPQRVDLEDPDTADYWAGSITLPFDLDSGRYMMTVVDAGGRRLAHGEIFVVKSVGPPPGEGQ